MTPLLGLTIGVIAIATPLSLGATWFLWQLYVEDRATFDDPARVSLSLVLALVVTATTVAGFLLAIPTAMFVAGVDSEVRRDAGQLVLIAIDILLIAPIAIAIYLRWLRGRYH